MDAGNAIWGVFLCLLSLAILSTNAYIFFLVKKRKQLQTRGNIFLLSLAFSDFAVALYNVPFTAASTFSPNLRRTGSLLCRLSGVLEMTFLIASVFSVTAMNFHRYIHIVYWYKYYMIFSVRRVCRLVLFMWAAAVALSIPPLFGLSKISYKPGKSHCFVHWKESAGYTLTLMIACFFVPVALMGFFYARIYCHRRSSKHEVRAMSKAQEMSSTVSKSSSEIELIPLSASIYKLGIIVENETVEEESTNGSSVACKNRMAVIGSSTSTNSLINHGYGSYEPRDGMLTTELKSAVPTMEKLDENACVMGGDNQNVSEKEQEESKTIDDAVQDISIELSTGNVGNSAKVGKPMTRRKCRVTVNWRKHRKHSSTEIKDNKGEDIHVSLNQYVKNNNLQSYPQANSKTLTELRTRMSSRRQYKGAATRKEKEDRKLTLMCVAIVAVFFISWSPFVVTMFLEMLTDIHILPVIDKATLVVGYMNSLANPIIYFYFNLSTKRHLMRLFKRHK